MQVEIAAAFESQTAVAQEPSGRWSTLAEVYRLVPLSGSIMADASPPENRLAVKISDARAASTMPFATPVHPFQSRVAAAVRTLLDFLIRVKKHDVTVPVLPNHPACYFPHQRSLEADFLCEYTPADLHTPQSHFQDQRPAVALILQRTVALPSPRNRNHDPGLHTIAGPPTKELHRFANSM